MKVSVAIATNHHPCELMLQEIEAILKKHDGIIYLEDDRMYIHVPGGDRVVLEDIDTCEPALTIPRESQSERLVIVC